MNTYTLELYLTRTRLVPKDHAHTELVAEYRLRGVSFSNPVNSGDCVVLGKLEDKMFKIKIGGCPEHIPDGASTLRANLRVMDIVEYNPNYATNTPWEWMPGITKKSLRKLDQLLKPYNPERKLHIRVR